MSGSGEQAGRARSLLPYAVVLVLGLLIATGIVLTAEHDPLAFAIPALVLTAVLLMGIRFVDVRSEERAMRDAARDTGLVYDGMRPIPPVTPLLRKVRGPAHILRGELEPGGPPCRLARLGRDRLVCLTDAPVPDIDAATREWLDDHPVRPQAAIEQRTLVVVAPGQAPPGALLRVARELHARLAAQDGALS